MRRTILCCLSLVLWFTLSLHQSSSASAGDLLPAGYCQYFSEADFISLDSGKLALPKALSKAELITVATVERNPAPQSSPTEVTPVVLAYVPRSVRTWDFNYQPMKAPIESPRVKLFWHTQKVSFRPKPTVTIEVRSQRKHIAPVLFWGTGSISDMTIATKLISHQFGDMLYSSVSPVQQFPIRVVRMMKRLF